MPLPLEGLRVLDLSRIWAGPYATRLLADMGAEVIKIEAARSYDPHRGPLRPAPGSGNYPDGEPGDEPWNRNGWFNSLHLSKYGITLDLSHPAGKAVFNRLVAISDALIENFRRGVLAKLGFDYETLRDLRPDIVVLSMPAFGNRGPWKDFIQYGIGQEQLAGVAYTTGYGDEEGPMKSGINHGDPITGSHAAGALLAALLHRRRTGRGLFIDLAHLDSSVSLMGEYILDFQMNGRNPHRRGNRHPAMAPHGVYGCKGDDEWVAIAVGSDAEWRALCQVLGMPQLAQDPRFSDASSRREHQDALDPVLGQWTKLRDAYEVMETLQAASVAAMPVLSAKGIFEDRHYQERRLLELVDHPSTGPNLLPGIGWKMSRTPGAVRWPSPRLGEHNEVIYQGLLGLSPEEVARLEGEGVIGKVPLGSVDA